MIAESAWSLSAPPNPTVLRLDTTAELTSRTIEACPPSAPPSPLDALLSLPGVRSIELHRHRARLNLAPGSDPVAVGREVRRVLAASWGSPALPRDEPVRAFPVAHDRLRLVAESPEMAGPTPILRALFGVRGVVEAVLEPGRVLVRLGRLFSWGEAETEVLRAVATAGRATGAGPVSGS